MLAGALTTFFCGSLLLLPGCGGAARNAETPSATPMKSGSITLEFWTLQLDAFADVLTPMFREYERRHPGVRIHWVDIPFSEGTKRTLTAMMSDSTPDVVNLNPDFSAVLASRKALVDMNRAVSPAVKASYLPAAWEAASLQRPGEKPIAFGLPWYVTSSVTLYNEAILHKAGLSRPPGGWAAMPAFVEHVRERTGAYGLMPTLSESGNFLKDLQKIGIPLYDAQGRAIFATPAAIAHLTRIVALYRAGAFPAEALTESHQAAIARYQAGTLAMLVIGPNFLKIVEQNAPAVYRETRIAPQFPSDAPYKDFALMLLTVPRKSAHPAEAVRFAEFVTHGRNQMALAGAAPVLPSVTSALTSVYQAARRSPNLMERARAISAEQLLRARGTYRIQPGQNTINQIVDYYIQLAMLGKLSPAEALKRAQHDIDETLKSSRVTAGSG
jgi:putative chitobiose transport system substrate-binding protein